MIHILNFQYMNINIYILIFVCANRNIDQIGNGIFILVYSIFIYIIDIRYSYCDIVKLYWYSYSAILTFELLLMRVT